MTQNSETTHGLTTSGRVSRSDALGAVQRAVEAFYLTQFASKKSAFIPASAKSFDVDELLLGVEAVLDGWWTEGRFSRKFAEGLVSFLGVRHCLLTNSGSSANLLAVSALTSHLLGERKLCPGDEVITVAAGFPTTINPIIQNGLVPVFVDVELGTYNTTLERVRKALSSKSRAIVLAHTLGNPYDAHALRKLCDERGMFLIEDCCDALGSTLAGQKVGTIGHLSTLSMYPAHHITTGEGGAVFTNDDILQKAVESIRDWGRDCWCKPGCSNTCGKRFSYQLGELPAGYDHKYTYSHFGYNLKITDQQAAIGLAQLKKLETFIHTRRRNFALLSERLLEHAQYLILPQATKDSSPSWFGFPITVYEQVDRLALTQFLEKNGVGTRLLFAGNAVKQPAYQNYSVSYRIAEPLINTDVIMERTFWIGVHPLIDTEEIEKIGSVFDRYFAQGKK